MKEVSLTNQLISICILIVGIICITLGNILPKKLLPIYEENIYNKLKQPLIFVNDINDLDKEDISSETDIAYIYIINENTHTVTILRVLKDGMDWKPIIVNWLYNDTH